MGIPLKIVYVVLSSLFLLLGCEETEDQKPPEVAITTPVNGVTLADIVLITAIALDDEVVASVELFIDGESFAVDTDAPFEFQWITGSGDNGDHTFLCKATDDSGNEALSELVTVRVMNSLFTASFTQDWLCPSCGTAVLFISDMAGNVLGEASWSGNDEVTIEADNILLDPGDSMMVTTVIPSSFGTVNITTYMAIVVGDEWTFNGVPEINYSNQQTITLDFQNVPDHSGYSLSTAYSSMSSTSSHMGAIQSLFAYEDPVSVYLQLNTTNDGVNYQMFENLSPGSHTLDLTTLHSTLEKTVQYPQEADGQYGYTSLYGYKQFGDYYHGRYRIVREKLSEGSSTSATTLYFPDQYLMAFRTDMYYVIEDVLKMNHVYGEVPDQFHSLNGNIEFLNVTTDQINFSTQGNFDQIRAYLRYSGGDMSYAWNVYGPSNLNQFILPQFSDLVQVRFPDLTREYFNLNYIDLIDYSDVTSHADIIDVHFHSSDYFDNVINEKRIYSEYYRSDDSVLERVKERELDLVNQQSRGF